MTNQCATWRLELWCDCPKCELYVDLATADDFWVDRNLQACEPRKGLDVVCPECGHEFEVDCEY
jgi:hypothetical protein